MHLCWHLRRGGGGVNSPSRKKRTVLNIDNATGQNTPGNVDRLLVAAGCGAMVPGSWERLRLRARTAADVSSESSSPQSTTSGARSGTAIRTSGMSTAWTVAFTIGSKGDKVGLLPCAPRSVFLRLDAMRKNFCGSTRIDNRDLMIRPSHVPFVVRLRWSCRENRSTTNDVMRAKTRREGIPVVEPAGQGLSQDDVAVGPTRCNGGQV